MKINERSLIEGLSYALDVAEKSYFSHSKHVAYTAVMLAMELGLSEDEQKDAYIAALLHDIGVSDTCLVLLENTNLVEEHCIFGRDIVLKLPVKPILSEYIYYHHEFYDGTGVFKLKGDEIPIISQIILLSDLFDVNFRCLSNFSLETKEIVKEWLEDNEEKFNPKISDAFRNIIDKEHFLLDYYNHEFNNIVTKKVKVKGEVLDYDSVVTYALAFAEIIDKRSPFTYRHSMGIANLVTKITKELGFEKEIQNKMYIAALLHDLGKLTISNDIIDKPGKLDEQERFEINKHTYYTRWILEQIEGFEDITEFASNHHEKLTGKGYPYQLKESQIGELDRVMTICDIYQALTEERPYRATMPIEKVWSIIDSMVDKGELDRILVEKTKVILKDYME